MQPLSDPVAATVQLMSAHRFERILDMPAFPTGRGGLCYPAVVNVDRDGRDWHVRANGTEFSIISRSWLRAGIQRCYSLGWGLTAAGQTDRLLMAQCFDPDPAVLGGLTAELGSLAVETDQQLGDVLGRICLRLVAVLRPAGGRDDG